MAVKHCLVKITLYLSAAATIFSPFSIGSKLPVFQRTELNERLPSYAKKSSLPAGKWGGWGLGPLTPPLPKQLSHPPLPPGSPPWGAATLDNTNLYTGAPNNGVVRAYEFTIERGVISPDGIEKPAILVNGQYPGPLIEANWGDMFAITVHNRITGPEEGAAIHWHGILQSGTPWDDGSPSIGSSPLAPGDTYVYRFIADVYGTSWWHAHYSGQYVGGILGPMVIYGPEDEAYDIDIGPILLQDWYHEDYFEIVKRVLAPSPIPIEPWSENTAINGKMDCLLDQSSICSYNPDLAKFEFTPGKVHRLRLVNSGAANMLRFSIDEHDLTVIANDFVPVEPYTTDQVTLTVGQRADVLVTANGTADSYWMRVNAVCSLSIQPQARAIVYYNRTAVNTARTADANIVNSFITRTNATAKPTNFTSANTTPNNATGSQVFRKFSPSPIPVPSTSGGFFADACGFAPLTQTVPKYPIVPPLYPSLTLPVTVDIVQNATQQWNWRMNGITFHGDYNDPALFLANAGDTSYPEHPEWNIYDLGNITSYRLITYNRSPQPHPMHLHGHTMYILAEGVGEWDGRITRPENPQRRDVHLLQPGGYLVIQADALNAGIWPYHCHIAWHLSGGLNMNFIEREEEIVDLRIPHGVWRMFEVWQMYSAANVVNQIDSGFWLDHLNGTMLEKLSLIGLGD